MGCRPVKSIKYGLKGAHISSKAWTRWADLNGKAGSSPEGVRDRHIACTDNHGVAGRSIALRALADKTECGICQAVV